MPLDQPTIQDAIDFAADGDTVLVAPGAYFENINFLGKAITVTSESGPDVTIIDGDGVDRVVTFNSSEGPTSVISGFTIRNGFTTSDGGGVFINSASPTVENNKIVDNVAPVPQSAQPDQAGFEQLPNPLVIRLKFRPSTSTTNRFLRP